MFAKENCQSDAGRRPFDPLLMMRVLFLQRLYGPSDKQIECQVRDRMNFRGFLDIENVDDILDENTVWKYEDMPANTGTWDRLFAKFTECLDTLGLIVTEGKNIDASFVTAPRQRNCREEHKRTKGWQGRAAMERPAAQEMPQGRGCPMGEETRRYPFRLQGPCGGMPEDQVREGLRSHPCQYVHDSKVAAHRKANQHGRMQGMWGQKRGCENAESCP